MRNVQPDLFKENTPMSTNGSTPNFASILDEAPLEITRTPPLPVGTYLCTIGQFELAQNENRPSAFPLSVVAPLDDVDEEILAEAGGCKGKILRYNVWHDERAAEALDTIHSYAGLDLATLGAVSRGQRNEMIQNMQVLAEVKHRSDKNDPSKVYAEVKRLARAD
jgi:hypothetical protein